MMVTGESVGAGGNANGARLGFTSSIGAGDVGSDMVGLVAVGSSTGGDTNIGAVE